MFTWVTLVACLVTANEFGFGKLQEPYEKDELSIIFVLLEKVTTVITSRILKILMKYIE